MKKTFLILFLYVILTSVLGYVREKFFLDINYLMYYKYYGAAKAWLPLPAEWAKTTFGNFSYEALYFMKFPFTVFFSLLFYVLGIFFFIMTGKKKLIRYYNFFYLLLFLFAGIMVVAGVIYWSKWDSPLYYLSRKFVGLEQSPVPALIIYIAGILSEKFHWSSDKLEGNS
ncbi:MAG: hypothetical protein N3F09_08285 [Bacteroidia bacterium]|nr:hypothetical protein [Bacteroidia bacterium]